MRHNQRLDYEGLRDAASEAVVSSGLTQLELADRLGYKSRTTISRALNERGAKFASVQRALLEHLTDFEVSDVGGFLVQRKG